MWEERVQRAQADHARAATRPLLDQPKQVAEIADAPVALRAQCVELHCGPPDPAAVLQLVGQIARPLRFRRLGAPPWVCAVAEVGEQRAQTRLRNLLPHAPDVAIR